MSMRNVIIAFMSVLCLASMIACNDYETYGDKKEKERKAIRKFIADSSIVVISESQFHANNDVTDLEKNEFVYLDNQGVYMQIVRKGNGRPLQDGENCDLLVRFLELCLLDTVALYNDTYAYDPDVMNVRRTGSTYTGSFVSGTMYSAYSATVPNGWLACLPYLNLQRVDDGNLSKVRLIVPHSQGHITASNYVYPYYYELTFQRKTEIYDAD